MQDLSCNEIKPGGPRGKANLSSSQEPIKGLAVPQSTVLLSRGIPRRQQVQGSQDADPLCPFRRPRPCLPGAWLLGLVAVWGAKAYSIYSAYGQLNMKGVSLAWVEPSGASGGNVLYMSCRPSAASRLKATSCCFCRAPAR